MNLDPTILIHAVLLFSFSCILCILCVVHKVTGSIRIRKKSKGVTLSALCKVLSFPRWVYFRTGRAGFRSRRDMSEDRANTHTLVNTHVMCNHAQKRKHKCTSTHTHNKHSVCRQGRMEALVFRAIFLPLAGSLSTPAHYTVPEDGELCTKQNMSGQIIRETTPNKYPPNN